MTPTQKLNMELLNKLTEQVQRIAFGKQHLSTV